MNTLNRIKKICIELLEAKETLTVENIVSKSLFSSGGTLAGYEKEIKKYLNKTQLGSNNNIVLSNYGNITIEYDGTEVILTDGFRVDCGYFDKKNNTIYYDNAYLFTKKTYNKALTTSNFYGIKSFY